MRGAEGVGEETPCASGSPKAVMLSPSVATMPSRHPSGYLVGVGRLMADVPDDAVPGAC